MIHSRTSSILLFGLLLAALSVLAAGCGGGKGQNNGQSLAQEYEAAKNETSVERRADRLISVAAKQRQANDAGAAKRSLDEAFEACKKIKDPSQQATACVSLAQGYQLIEEPDAVRGALNIARDATKKISQQEDRALQWTSMARLQIRLDNQAMAQDHLNRVDELIDQIESPDGRLDVLVAVAELAHAMHKASESDRFLKLALDTATRFKGAGQRSQAQVKIAAAQARMDQPTAAMVSFKQAEAFAADVEKPVQKANLLIDLALALAAVGEKKRAKEILAEAKSVAEKIADVGYQNSALDRIYRSKKEI
ncbi:MAG: hypothetical protein IID44_24685 [Planctomycetes bacterium]|nr:hypothetical protein [Planctomycetota bacterium]